MSVNWDLTDPFKTARENTGILETDFAGESIPMILGHRAIRRAARDTGTYSSDAPFRVPVPGEEPFRDVRELPIETDPPEHTAYRQLVRPYFERPKSIEMIESITRLTADLMDQMIEKQNFEVIRDFAVKVQSRGLALLLKRPPEDGLLWENWNTNVLYEDRTRAELYAYLSKTLAAAAAAPGDDFFGHLSTATLEGRKLTNDEILGYAILAFAGGRDTVISVIAFAMVHFADHPEDLTRLREDPELIRTAAEEFIRICSPLTHIGRLCPHGADLDSHQITPGERASLCWAAANRDASVFTDPDEVKIDRLANPHVAFGAGPHTCLGNHQARLILRRVLTELSTKVLRIELIDGEAKYDIWPQYRRQTGFETLNVRVYPLA